MPIVQDLKVFYPVARGKICKIAFQLDQLHFSVANQDPVGFLVSSDDPFGEICVWGLLES